jgi:hypothetical protein
VAAGTRVLVIAAAVLAAAAQAQDPSTRRIETTPRIELRPPTIERPVSRRAPVEALPPLPGHEHDRRLDIELDLKARRERIEGEDPVSHYLAAAAIVVGSGIAVLAILAWAAKRRDS